MDALRNEYNYSVSEWSDLLADAKEALELKNQSFKFESKLLKNFVDRLTALKTGESNIQIQRKKSRKKNREEKLISIRNARYRQQMKDIAKATQIKYKKLFLKRKCELAKTLTDFSEKKSKVIEPTHKQTRCGQIISQTSPDLTRSGQIIWPGHI